MDRINVLVFPYGTEIANEIVAALRHHKYFQLVFATSDIATQGCFEEGRIHLLPYVDAPQFVDRLQELIEARSIRCVIPAHDDAAWILARHQGDIGAIVVGQSASVNEVVRFKDKTYADLQNLVQVPNIFNTSKDLPYPVFIKPKKGQGSFDASKITTAIEYDAFFMTRDRNNYLVAEYLPGTEYTIDCFSSRGNLRYAGARTRERTIKGISVVSRTVVDEETNIVIEEYARKLSQHFQMHGIWFFQLKEASDGSLVLLEIGPRVSGTMMVNRVRGINFVELAIYQALGHEVEVKVNNIHVLVRRTLVPSYQHDLEYSSLYVDFDDTLCLDKSRLNLDVVKIIFDAKNNNKEVVLLTKNQDLTLAPILHRFGITSIFDRIVHIERSAAKTAHIPDGALLIDDSFSERCRAMEQGVFALGLDAVELVSRSLSTQVG
jgi:hypothetical protein